MELKNKVVHRDGKWYVYSEDGKKKLGGPYDAKGEADKRLREIEYFKEHPKKNYHNVVFNLQPKGVRNERMADKDYLVVPCVMLVEGVHAGNEGAYYYSADELSKRPAVWNMKPVVVYHPTEPSACDPSVINTRGVGVLMNTKWDGRLTTEAWLEKSRVEKVDKRILDAVEKETTLELSTGLYADSDEIAGEWNGEEFKGSLTNFGPDHLAILPDQVGACSVADGAGFFRNEAGDQMSLSPKMWMEVQNELGSNELRRQLEAPIQRKDKMQWVENVYDTYFIYSDEKSFYRQDYKVEKDVARLEGSAEAVQRVVKYEPVKNETSDERTNIMKDKIINDLIANKATLWAEKDREYLNGLDEDVLKKMVPVQNEQPPAPKPETKNEDLKPDTVNVQNKQKTMEEYLAEMPPEIRKTVQNSMKAEKREKDRLVAIIMKNEHNTFTKEYLDTMDVEMLTNMAALAAPAKDAEVTRFNYGGQGDPVDTDSDANVPVLETPTTIMLNQDRDHRMGKTKTA